MTNQTITKSFQAVGHTVNVTGKFIEQEEYTYPSLDLTEMQDVYKTTLDIVVEGVGSQGSNIQPRRFSKNGIDYTHIVGRLPLTAEQMEIINSVKAEIEAIKNSHPVIIARREQNELDREMYEGKVGSYEDVERKHSWMSGTY